MAGMIDEDRENLLRSSQDGRVYPLGRALRSTYDSDNHDTLGTDVTGLMIDLSKVPFEAAPPASARPAAIDPPPAATVARSWRHRFGALLGRP